MKNSIKKGFTLVELLFVMAIIAILAGFAIANLKDSTKLATENSIKNDVKNAIAQQQTYFAANQEYTSLTGSEVATNGMVTSADGVKFTFSKGNTITTTGNTDCGDGILGFEVQVVNESIDKPYHFDSCTDGTIQNGLLPV